MSISDLVEGSFDLRFDPSRGVATAIIDGVWTHATVNRWEAELNAIIAANKSWSGRIRMFCDGRKSVVLAKEIAARVEDLTIRNWRYFDRVAVIVSESALYAIQIRRLLANGSQAPAQQRYFGAHQIAEAEAWIADRAAD